MIGIDPLLADPAHLDFRPTRGSPAAGYGCLTFPAHPPVPDHGDDPFLPPFAKRQVAARPDAVEEVAGLIAHDTVWDAGLTRVVGDVKVGEGSTLTVAPGVRVEFAGHYGLQVVGNVQAVGEPARPILFTSADPHAFAVDSTLTGAWNGIRFERTPASQRTSRFEHCVIEYAKAVRDTALVGAVVMEDFSKAIFVNSILRRNVADYGAAVFCIRNASPRFVGCVIAGNSALRGGSAVWTLDSHPRFIHCTIVDNHDLNEDIYTPSGAVVSFISKPRFEGCIVRGNTTAVEGWGQTWMTKAAYVSWCDVEGGHDGEQNIDLDPVFVGAGRDPYSLAAGSPCIDAGPEFADNLLPAVDILGNPRVTGGRVDLGAYEGGEVTGVAAVPPAAPTLRAHPNPFNPRTDVAFDLPRAGAARVEILDARGAVVRTLHDGDLPAGPHALHWDGADDRGRALPSGVYVVRLDAAGAAAATKITLVR